MVTSNDGIRNAKKRSVISSEGDMLVQHVGIVTQVGGGIRMKNLEISYHLNVEVEVKQKFERERERECANISCFLIIC